MEHKTIKVEKKEHVAIITFNRPEAMNALSTQMAQDLIKALEDLTADREVWVAILTGAGDRSFCVGADLKERKNMSKEEMRIQRALFVRTFQGVSSFPKPIIAAVNGYALGGGCEFAVGCDIILASEKAAFGLPEVALGIIPGGGGTQNLPRLIGRQKAKELIFTGRRLTAQEAVEWGIARRVAAPENLLAEAMVLAGEITKNAPIAVWQAKKAVNIGLDVGLSQGFAFEAEAYNVCLATDDRDEGLRAFNEKRRPSYQGK